MPFAIPVLAEVPSLLGEPGSTAPGLFSHSLQGLQHSSSQDLAWQLPPDSAETKVSLNITLSLLIGSFGAAPEDQLLKHFPFACWLPGEQKNY